MIETSEGIADDPVYPLARGPLAAFLSASRECLVGRLDATGAVLDANPALRRVLGKALRLPDALSPEGVGRWEEAVAALDELRTHRVVELPFGADPGPVALYRCLIHREGAETWVFGERAAGPADPLLAEVLELHVELARLNRALHRRAIELERSRDDVAEQARTDALTGLANRRQADSRLGLAVARAEAGGAPLACLVIDLDHFKAINDAHGHPVGDLALRQAAEALAGGIRPTDFVARIGGEEFLVLAPGADAQGARILAERLREAIAAREVPPLGRGPTASLGVAALRPGESAEALFRRADAALMRAKAAGRDRVEVDP